MRLPFLLRALQSIFPRRHRIKARACMIIFLIVFGGGTTLYLQGKAVKVADGDSLVVLSGANTHSVRLYGIDAPEHGQLYGEEAREFTKNLAYLKPLELEVIDTDKYGRQVALVRLPDGRVLNEELVASGLAMVYRNYCKTAVCVKLLTLEAQAKDQRLGVWAQKRPIPPWVWRSQSGPKKRTQ